MKRFLAVFLFLLTSVSASLAAGPQWKSGYFQTSDGIRLHYLEAGSGPAVVFIPGWTMPADIWEHQIAYFSQRYHVVALDPRSQGDSDKPADGNYPERRARDYKELVEQLKLAPAVLVGWSMGVPELLTYVDQFGTDGVRALVLVDGGLAFKESLLPQLFPWLHKLQEDRRKYTLDFVRSMYKKPQSPEYLARVTEAALKTPTNTAIALIAGELARLDLSPVTAKLAATPVLFVGTPQQKEQADLLHSKLPSARIEIFEDAGHALFVDDADRFNALLEDFLSSAKTRKPSAN